MNNIKSYLYLDEYKLYSISSQLFKGLTEYILQTSSTNNTEETDQKGPVGSGRILADIFREETTNEEKKTLYDYAFNLLEEELINYDKVIEINESNVDKKISALENATFIKVSGLAIFNDMKMLSDLIENFNELGESLGYFANRDEFENFFNSYEGESSNPKKDRNKQAKSNFMSKKMREQMEKLLEEKELRLKPHLLDYLKYLIDFGFQGQFEVKIPFYGNNHPSYFSSVLNRNYLREDEFSLISKYSRKTEKEFTIFGILTQNKADLDFRKGNINSDNSQLDESQETAAMKEAILSLVDKMSNVEQTFNGKLSYEYIIDPIAIYREF